MNTDADDYPEDDEGFRLPNTLAMLAITLGNDTENCLTPVKTDRISRLSLYRREHESMTFQYDQASKCVVDLSNWVGTTLEVLVTYESANQLDWAEDFDLADPDCLAAVQARLSRSGIRFKTGVEW